VSDRGLGMTGEEIKKYINQIAFSGAAEFVEKFKDKADAKDIIGKFGLDSTPPLWWPIKLNSFSKSYKDGTEAARWECDGSTEFELTPASKENKRNGCNSSHQQRLRRISG